MLRGASTLVVVRYNAWTHPLALYNQPAVPVHASQVSEATIPACGLLLMCVCSGFRQGPCYCAELFSSPDLQIRCIWMVELPEQPARVETEVAARKKSSPKFLPPALSHKLQTNPSA